jgi:hypothetical protein
MSAYEHGMRAFFRAKHLQANPFDTGTPDWNEWRRGYFAGNQRPMTAYDYNNAR